MRRLSSLLGNAQRLDGGAMFGNAPRELWSRWAEPDARNRIPVASRCLLVREPRRTLLFETGVGAFFEPRLRERYGVTDSGHVLLDALADRGLGPADVDVVVLSHLHFDHAGGLLSAWRQGAQPEIVFPTARVLVGRQALERARAPHPRDRASFVPGLVDRLEASGRLEVVEDVEDAASEALGPGYRFHLSHGHTPGLLLTEIEMPGGPVLFASDLAPGRAWVHLPITMGYDRSPERLVDEKRALFASLVERGGRLFYYHDPEVALSRLALDERGRFHPTEPVASLDDLRT